MLEKVEREIRKNRIGIETVMMKRIERTKWIVPLPPEFIAYFVALCSLIDPQFVCLSSEIAAAAAFLYINFAVSLAERQSNCLSLVE